MIDTVLPRRRDVSRKLLILYGSSAQTSLLYLNEELILRASKSSESAQSQKNPLESEEMVTYCGFYIRPIGFV